MRMAIIKKSGGGGGAVGTAKPPDVLAGKTFSSNEGTGLVGTMPNQGKKDFTPGKTPQTIPAGYHNGQGEIDSLGGDAEKGDVLIGKTFSSDIEGRAVTGTMPNQGAMIITPTRTGVIIPAGYHNGQGVVVGDPNFEAGNIKEGVEIWGVVGTLTPDSPPVGNALPEHVLAGKTFESAEAGTGAIGTMVDRGAVIITPSSSDTPIPEGYHNGQGYVRGVPKYKDIISDVMVKWDESADYGGTIRALAFDGTYLYAGGGTTGKVWKINPSTMSKVAESANYGSAIYALAFDDTYLYVGGYTKTVWKINPSTMSKVAESANYGGAIYALAFDGTYLYAGGYAKTVWKINPSTMSKVAESANYGGSINALAFDGTYLYAGGATTGTVWKINPSDMSLVAESANYGGTINALAFDGTYLYAGGVTTGTVWKINPSDMSKVAESAYYGLSIEALAFDGTYLYAGGDTTGKVWKINPSTMSKVAESAEYGGAIYALAFDGTYLYAGGSTTKKVWKIIGALYIREV